VEAEAMEIVATVAIVVEEVIAITEGDSATAEEVNVVGTVVATRVVALAAEVMLAAHEVLTTTHRILLEPCRRMYRTTHHLMQSLPNPCLIGLETYISNHHLSNLIISHLHLSSHGAMATWSKATTPATIPATILELTYPNPWILEETFRREHL